MNIPSKYDNIRFRRQWLITDDAHPPHNLFNSFPLTNKYFLHYHPDLIIDKHELKASNIYILGLSIHTGSLTSSPFDSLADYSPGNLEEWLEELTGIYAVLVCEGTDITIYTDPAGLMGIYYNNNHHVASTPILLPGVQKNESLSRIYTLKGSDDWFPGSLTPYVNVKALMANHYLKLCDLSTTRFWPKEGLKQMSLNVCLESISEMLKSTFKALETKGKIYLSLTSGKDSRLNLSAAREIKDRVVCFTIKNKDVESQDLIIASKITKTLGISHKVIIVPEPDEELLAVYDEITSNMSIGGRRAITNRALLFPEKNAIHVNGNIGAYMKALFWPKAFPTKFSHKRLLKEFVNKASPIKDALNEWSKSLPKDIHPVIAYNLMYLEQRGGRWAGMADTGSSMFYIPFSPINSRKMFSLVCNIPQNVQYARRVPPELISYIWPELGSIPYGKKPPSLGKLLPKWIKPFLRKIISRTLRSGSMD